jgi:hypothetical protein
MVSQNLTQKDWITGAFVEKASALVADGAELVAFVRKADELL